MADGEHWGFYGRGVELAQLTQILARDRWFFVRVTGRRRIGKTTLIQEALKRVSDRPRLYVQIPDSAPAGVVSAVADALSVFEVDVSRFPAPRTLGEFASLIGKLVRAGYVIVLDEFQYFSRKKLAPFTSLLQAQVDALSADAGRISGGLIVLGSIHAELVALIEDRDAPLYNRTTDNIELPHLDVASVLEILRAHSDADPKRLLFLWTLFEGVPKFYRDAFEQGVLGASRSELLRKMFFRSSSPLRTEAENWFLGELRGRYDVVLKYVARRPGCTQADLLSYVHSVTNETDEQVGGYIKLLIDRFGLVERRLPIFASSKARSGRYYIRDKFLRAWLAALQSSVSAINFRPEDTLVERADSDMENVEGHAFERLVGVLYEERSRKGIPGFPLTHRLVGYWDRKDTEIDLVAVHEENKRIRFGSCKRSGEKLIADLDNFAAHVERFLAIQPKYRSWTIERVCLAPVLTAPQRTTIGKRGFLAEDLGDLLQGLSS